MSGSEPGAGGSDCAGSTGGGRVRHGHPGEAGQQLLRPQADAEGPDRADGPAGLVSFVAWTLPSLTQNPCLQLFTVNQSQNRNDTLTK